MRVGNTPIGTPGYMAPELFECAGTGSVLREGFLFVCLFVCLFVGWFVCPVFGLHVLN